MQKYVTIITIALTFASCSFSSFSPKYTEVAFPNYRIPDSLTVYNDSISAASILWRNYYEDENLRNLIDEGLKNNYTLHSALLQIEKSESYVVKSRKGFYPSLSLGVSQNEQKRSLRESAYNEHGIALQLTGWELDIWGKLRSLKRAALADLLSKESSAKAVKVKLIADIATHYYRLICLDSKLQTVNEIISSNEEFLDRQIELKQSQERLNSKQIYSIYEKDKILLPNILSSSITISDVAIEQTKAELYKAQAIKPDIEADIFVTENALNLLLSRHDCHINALN